MKPFLGTMASVFAPTAFSPDSVLELIERIYPVADMIVLANDRIPLSSDHRDQARKGLINFSVGNLEKSASVVWRM